MIRFKKACLIAVGLVMTVSMSCVSAKAETIVNDIQASSEITGANDESLQNTSDKTDNNGTVVIHADNNEEENDKDNKGENTQDNAEERVDVKPFEVLNVHDKLFLYVNGVQYSEPGWLKEKEINAQATINNMYYIEQDGTAALGWLEIDNNWYYFNEQGIMQKGWQTIKGSTYYLNDEGIMQKGWQEIDGNKYYFGDSGIAAVGKKYIDGNWYYFAQNGKAVIGRYYENGKIYYCNSNGVMGADKWLDFGEDGKYYVKSDGTLAVGNVIVNGKLEVFDSTGKYMETKDIDVPYLYVKSLNVGNADCAFIRLPNGETALIDTGVPESSEKVVNFLKSQNLKKSGSRYKINYVLITHGHSDHIGGLRAVLENFDVDKVYMPSIAKMKNWYSGIETTEQNKADIEMLKYDYEVYKDAEKAMEENGKEFVNTVKGQSMDSSNILQFIQSDSFFGTCGADKLTENFWGLNNDSAIVYLNYGALKMLFTADLEWTGEHNFVFNKLLQGRTVNVLKVGHHGNDTSSTAEFLNYVNPQIGIISRASESVVHNTAYGNLINKGIHLYETSADDGVGIYATTDNWTVDKNN